MAFRLQFPQSGCTDHWHLAARGSGAFHCGRESAVYDAYGSKRSEGQCSPSRDQSQIMHRARV
jgi:hypothetical protein